MTVQNTPAPGPILVVEDEEDIRTMLAFMLQHEGYTVVQARNGMEAYNLARTHQPSLILLDLMMPVMSGEEFRRAQLANQAIQRIPVVVLSARHDVRSTARAMKAAAYLLKPLDLDALSSVVARHCRRPHG